MSENIPESIPTSISNKSHRPLKKRALTPSTQQSGQVEALFANPSRADNAIAVGPKAKVALAPPEIVANVQGSSAGAGSGEFHVYKASRRREYERLRMMDEEVKIEEAEKDFLARKEERDKKDEEKLSKNRARRQKAKQRLEKKKLGNEHEEDIDAAKGDSKKAESGSLKKKKLGPAKVARLQNGGNAHENGEEQVAQEEVGITIHDDD